MNICTLRAYNRTVVIQDNYSFTKIENSVGSSDLYSIHITKALLPIVSLTTP